MPCPRSLWAGEHCHLSLVLYGAELLDQPGRGHETDTGAVAGLGERLGQPLVSGHRHVLALEAEVTDAQLLQQLGEPVRASAGHAQHSEVRSLLARLLDVAEIGCEYGSACCNDDVAGGAAETGMYLLFSSEPVNMPSISLLSKRARMASSREFIPQPFH